MGKAIVYTAVCGAAALISILWSVLDRGEPAVLSCIASLLAIAIVSPVLMRKDFQFVGIPGLFEIIISLGALAAAIYGGLKRSELWFWSAVIVQTIPTLRISLVSLKAYERPKSLKITVGICLAAILGLNVFLGVRHSAWLGENSVALVKEWFPEATGVKLPPAPPKGPPAPPSANPKGPPPPPPTVDQAKPVAFIAGRPLTAEMVEYQRFIDSLIDEKLGRNDAVAALLQAYASRAILEKKFTFDPAILRDEHQWVMNRVSDRRLIEKIRAHKSDDLFLEVYVGANGLYKRKLGEIFDKRKQEELKKRAAEVLKEVQAADGVERPGPKVESVVKDECRYSAAKGEFVLKFSETDDQAKPNPKDTLAPKLATIKVNTALAEVLWGDMNGLVIRRVQDDFKGRPIYEVYRVVEQGVYTHWFKKQCADFVIEIPDPDLRRSMLELAKDVNHIIKTK